MFSLKRLYSLVEVVLCFTMCVPNVLAAESTTAISIDGSVVTGTGSSSYESFLTTFKNASKPEDVLTLTSDNLIAEASSGYSVLDSDGRKNVCVLNGEDSRAAYGFNVRQEGLYQLYVTYRQFDEEKITDIKFDALLDGNAPFTSAKSITLTRYWKLNGDKKYDSRGNELCRSWVQYPQWEDSYLYDCEGRYNDPLYFYLSAGTHTLIFDFEYSGIAIEKAVFCNASEADKYLAEGKTAADTPELKLEAEDFVCASDSAIAVNIEKTDPGVTPNSVSEMRYNTVGGNSFSKSSQKICWTVNAEKSGYYYIAFKARQNIKKGYFSTRSFKIDGVTPYAECRDIRFTYSDDWRQFVLSSDSGEPMLFYFDAGKAQEISLECVPGQLSSAMSELDECIERLNSIFLEVRMAVGNTADKYRDYYLVEDIPELENEVNSVLKKLEEQKEFVQSVGGTKGGDLSALQTIITQLRRFRDDIDEMALKLNTFKGNISSLSAWVSDLKTQPLELDSVTLFTDSSRPKRANQNFFVKMLFNFRRLMLSFSEDYGVVGDYDNSEEINVWVSTGQDQLDIIRNLITDKYDGKASVRLQLVPTGLLEAAMAGKGPDTALFIAGDIPVNMASRGGLIDLSELSGYDEVKSCFAENACVPYTYKDGCYAVPLTQGFNMLFVRTDVFEQLGLKVPDTWSDFFGVLPVLQRNNLEAGIPSDLSTFATFALQNGGTYYNDELTATAFGKQPETAAFIQWTTLFTEKGLPLAYDFSNRFRTGEMPIGIADYSMYAMLETSAPEISGSWEMFPMPATADENGNLNRKACCATSGTVGIQQGNTCAVILKGCKRIDAAWDFLKWFTSASIQTSYGLELEKRMGVAARYTPANKETLSNLPWTGDEQKLLYEQWNQLVLLPEIPGSYYVTRNLNNAFRKVVYNSENPVHTLNKYNEIINHEIERKRKGLQKDG